MRKVCEVADADIKDVKNTLGVLVVATILCVVLLFIAARWMISPVVYRALGNLIPVAVLFAFLVFVGCSLVRQLRMVLREAARVEMDDSSIVVTFVRGGAVRIDRGQRLSRIRTRVLSTVAQHNFLNAIWFRTSEASFLVSDRCGDLRAIEAAFKVT